MTTPRNDPSIEDIFQEAQRTHAFRLEAAKIEFTEEMVRLMEDLGISKSGLARMVGVSPAYVTKILRGTTNFTLDSMVKIAEALGAELRCHLAPKGAETRWLDCASAQIFAHAARPPVVDTGVPLGTAGGGVCPEGFEIAGAVRVGKGRLKDECRNIA